MYKFTNKYLNLIYGPILYTVFGLGVIFVVLSFFFTDTLWFGNLSAVFSIAALAVLIPALIFGIIYVFIVMPTKYLIKKFKKEE